MFFRKKRAANPNSPYTVPWDDVLAYMATEDGCEWYIVEAEGKPASLEPCLVNCRFLLDRLG